MNRSILFTPEATEDLNQIWLYLATEADIDIADSFVDQIRDKCHRIARSSEGYRLRPELLPLVRSYPFKSYVIFYTPIESGIEVFRVLHSARDIPEVFSDRD
ncbi:MAG: type II toxin-antitoxin system RelE/ParE family toxin [Pyrinomonadaceae bacterium]